jgi:hypothetical protein
MKTDTVIADSSCVGSLNPDYVELYENRL